MADDYKGYTVPSLNDVPDYPAAFKHFADSVDGKLASQFGTWRKLPTGGIWDANQEVTQGVLVSAVGSMTTAYKNIPYTGISFIMEILSADSVNMLQRITYYDGRMFERYYRLNYTWSAWFELQRVEDSGEVLIPPGGSWKYRDDWPFRVRRRNGVLFVTGGLEGVFPGGESDLGHTPVGYRPSTKTVVPFASSNNVSGIAIWGTDGGLSLVGSYASGINGNLGLFLFNGTAIAA